jgi:hypothetical protein
MSLTRPRRLSEAESSITQAAAAGFPTATAHAFHVWDSARMASLSFASRQNGTHIA